MDGVRSKIWPIAFFFVTAGAMFSASGCSDDTPPPIQTLPKSTRSDAPPREETTERPTSEQVAEARHVLDRAIVAHGGPVRLQRLRRHIQQQKGTLMTGRFGVVQADMELKLDLPDRLRFNVKAVTPEGQYPISIGFDRGQSWMTENSVARDITPEVAQSLKAELHYRHLLTLLPLLESEFVLRPIDAAKFDQRATRGIRVSSKQSPPLDLFFDAENYLLVRTLGWFLEGGVWQLREVQFRDFHDVDGLKLPRHLIDIRDGSPWVDCTITYSLPPAIDEAEFKKP